MIKVRKLKAKTVALLLEYTQLHSRQTGGLRPPETIPFELTPEQIGQVIPSKDALISPTDLYNALLAADLNIHFSEEQKRQVSDILAQSSRFADFDNRFNQYRPMRAAIVTSTAFMVGIDAFAFQMALGGLLFHMTLLTWTLASTFLSVAGMSAGVFAAIYHYKVKRRRDDVTNGLVHQFIYNQVLELKRQEATQQFSRALSAVIAQLKTLHELTFADNRHEIYCFGVTLHTIIALKSEKAQFEKVRDILDDFHQRALLPEDQYRYLTSVLRPASKEIAYVEIKHEKLSLSKRIKKAIAPKMQGGAATSLTFFGIGVGVFSTYQGIVTLLPAASVMLVGTVTGPLLGAAIAVTVAAAFTAWVYKNNKQYLAIKKNTREVKQKNFLLNNQVMDLMDDSQRLVQAESQLSNFIIRELRHDVPPREIPVPEQQPAPLQQFGFLAQSRVAPILARPLVAHAPGAHLSLRSLTSSP